MSQDLEWKKCSSCKKPIALNTRYYTCSVSSCNTNRTGYVFCSVPCFDQHIPKERHKSAGAIEAMSPKQKESTVKTQGQRRIIPSQKLSQASNKQVARGGEVLVIASRMKEFISEQSEFNTSAIVMNILSDHLRHVAMQAIDNAREAGRKTVMEQDLNFLDKLNLNI